MVALFFYTKKCGYPMKKNYLSVYKCNEFRVVSNEFVGRIEDTPENISAFVVSADFNCNYALVDDMDTVKVFTMGNYLDLVPDTEYLEKELRPVLLQMQFGEIEIPEVRYEAIKKSLEEFLGEKGLSSPISDFLDDKLRSNRQLKTQRGARKFYSDANKQRMEYAKKRSEAIKEYNTLVKEGKIIPKTLIERTLDKAQGHSDNPSVQAARRIAEKRGYDWRTGERLENAKIDNVQIVQLEVYKTGELKGYADFSVEIGDGKVEGLYRIYDPENGKEQTIVSFDNGYSSKEIIDTYSNTIETELKLATEDTYHSMIKADKNFDEIEQDDFDHDDIEI